MKTILGLDLGTNSIGWAVVNEAETNTNGTTETHLTNIDCCGSRIIPIDAGILGDFDKGNSVSQTKERTGFRGTRHLRERNLQRRERLFRVLHILGFLPEHFDSQIGFDRNNASTYGKFIDASEPKIAWEKDSNGNYQFVFKDSFNEMLQEFHTNNPNFLAEGNKIPYDWTIYYLRKKALTQEITKEELAWILLQFNQKRGYYQLRGEEEEENPNKKVEFYALKVVKVEQTEDKKGDEYWYNVHLENGWIYRRTSAQNLDWEGKVREFIVTTDLNADGSEKTDNDGTVKRSFRSPKEDDWNLIKKRTEFELTEYLNQGGDKSVGSFIYESLLHAPNQKIIGKLIRTIERKFYKVELIAILKKQVEFHKELKDKQLYQKCVEELYHSNVEHRNSIANNDFVYLFVNDIIFYQRPLKSKKTQIADCPYESRGYKKKDDNGILTEIKEPLKCIAKSNPLFQEFRLWQFVSNLRIYEKKDKNDVDVTCDFLKTAEDYAKLFNWLNNKANIKQDTLFKSYFKKKAPKNAELPYRWNYIEDKEYPCNKTRAAILAKLNKEEAEKLGALGESFLSAHMENLERKIVLIQKKIASASENNKNELQKQLACLEKDKSELSAWKNNPVQYAEYVIWHLLYSVTTQAEIDSVFSEKKKGTDKGIYAEFRKHFSKESIQKLKNIKFDDKDYGSYSEKAIKKLLSLMRTGTAWNEDAIDAKTKERIEKIITGEYDEKIHNRVREKAITLTNISQFKGLPLWLACYIVYDRHSESKEIDKWENPCDIDEFLRKFKQHSLRNPIVEQVITETLRTVRDIWKQVGRIDEIHIELGREMKNPADKRKRMSKNILENENTNLRIKAILSELANPEYHIQNVKPYSPSQQDILKIYESYALSNLDSNDADYEFISKMSKTAQPSKSDITKYKCWLEQKYRSPYTGEIISLSKLFTSAYEIEHIIPQSRYFDDSFSNKVICEAEVNKLKDNLLGLEFIKKHHGEKVTLSDSKTVEIFSEQAYEKFVTDNYKNSPTKRKNLLREDLPNDFIERQMNDTRYISKYVKGLLSNIVREKDANGEWEQEAVSKNLISSNGEITSRLKKDWGMDTVWNHIILPRFIRMNEITHTEIFTAKNKEGHTIPDMPLELQKGFNKKRIDHRHHAMDAIVIACTTRDHVNLLNNEAAKAENKDMRYQLSHKLRRYEKVVFTRNGETKEACVPKEFLKPWDTFTTDTQKALENIIVSIKQNLRVINKTTNYYQYYDTNGNKISEKQTKGDSWAIRKSLHKDTVFGEVNLRFTKTVSLKDALKNPKAIVEKDLKAKLIELIEHGKNEKQIKAYFEENKEIWNDIKLSKIEVYYYTKDTDEHYYATRKPLDISFDEKKIKSITDTGIQKILLKHLKNSNDNVNIAFSPEGIERMNANITALNGGKKHQPILKVRVYEQSDNKFAVGQNGNKSSKFVVAAKGTNLFFAIYQVEYLNNNTGELEKKREYATVPLNIVIDCQKRAQKAWKEELDRYLRENTLKSPNAQLLFILSPNDLVYLPTKEQITNGISNIDKTRIYKFVSCSGMMADFVPATSANTIFTLNKIDQKKKFDKENFFSIYDESCNNPDELRSMQDEYGIGSPKSKNERAITGEMIKETCVPLIIDRLGNILSIG